MNTLFPTWFVDGPPPIPPTFGLLQAAAEPAAGVRLVDDTDGQGRIRWLNGITVYSYPPDTASVWAACESGSLIVNKPFGDSIPNPEFEAFTVVVGETCTASRIPDQNAFIQRATMVLEAVEGAAVELELLSGTLFPSQPYLADGSGTFPNGSAATKPNNAIGLLEGEIAKSGRQGVIHCSPMMATALMGTGFALRDHTGVIRTINGIVVIPGFGYVYGHEPLGQPQATGSQEWMYATGPIDIRRSEIFVTPDNVSQALDRGSGATNGLPNAITYRAERYYVLDWDTAVQAAVLADRCSTTC